MSNLIADTNNALHEAKDDKEELKAIALSRIAINLAYIHDEMVRKRQMS